MRQMTLLSANALGIVVMDTVKETNMQKKFMMTLLEYDEMLG